MKLTSTAFEHEGKIPRNYTCEGTNVNPPLSIHDIPPGTKSLALIMDDPDAIRPANKVWDHWIIFNMPPTTTEINEGEQPQGIPGKGTSDNLRYQGPCPPDAEHRYYFKLYALNALLELPPGATKQQVEQAMEKNILAQATLMGRYKKQQLRD